VGTTEAGLAAFLNDAMRLVGATTQPGAPVLNCFMNPEKRYAFVELRCGGGRVPRHPVGACAASCLTASSVVGWVGWWGSPPVGVGG